MGNLGAFKKAFGQARASHPASLDQQHRTLLTFEPCSAKPLSAVTRTLMCQQGCADTANKTPLLPLHATHTWNKVQREHLQNPHFVLPTYCPFLKLIQSLLTCMLMIQACLMISNAA
jgi:hypothetical protein